MTLRGTFARNLRRLRRARSLSQEELAALAGLNRNYVGMLEREEYAASIDVLERLAAALGVEPVELLEQGANPRPARP
jgi:transcriptional regulator with XRE-family HTH domain